MTKIFNRASRKNRRRQLRKRTTPQEIKLWERLRKRQVEGYQFNRQHGVGPYSLNFYCKKARLVVEVDGGYHESEEMLAHDKSRDAYCHSLGLKVLRVTNRQVDEHIEDVIEAIREQLTHQPLKTT